MHTEQLRKYLQKIDRLNLCVVPRKSEIALIFVDENEMRNLNRCYRGKDSPTDVLSFNLISPGDPLPDQPLFGEIYISLPVARRQAKDHGHSLPEELNILFVHGVLHLLGFDHESDSDFAKMNALEKIILTPSKSS